MKCEGLALLGLALVLGASACDGGSSGTGITTIAGNVASVVTATAGPGMAARPAVFDVAAATGDLAGIRVRVEGTDVSDDTDASGNFRLSGDYDSLVTVSFRTAQDGADASVQVNVPAGGTLTLRDVVVDASRGQAIPLAQEVSFDGVLTAVDCDGGTLQLVSRERPDDGDVYDVRLAGSTLVDGDGAPVACTDLAIGEDAAVSGSVNEDGSFGDATIVVGN